MDSGAAGLAFALALALVACASAQAGDTESGPDASGAPGAVSGADGGGTASGADGAAAAPPGLPQPDAGAPGGFAPAPHPPAPKVVNVGGPVITPRIVPITYPGDPLAADIDAFTARIGATPYWSAVTSEYGVGPATTTPPVHLASAAPSTIDDAQIQQWLKTSIGGALPAAAPGIVYAVFYPPGTVVSWNGASGCDNVEGYHWDLALSGATSVAYVVVPRCAKAIGAPNVAGLDVVTLIASHEYIEAATDPLPSLQPGFGDLDADHAIWGVQENVEVGDLCAYIDDVAIKPAGLDYVVQRTWSNASAAAGHDPCVPARTDVPFFASVPSLDDAVTISVYGRAVTTKGVRIAAGQSRTIDLTLFSDAPTAGPWTVSAVDAPSYGVPSTTHHLSFAIDRTTGQNGDHVKLTITADGYDAQLGGAPFMISSTMGGHANAWFGVAAP